MKFRFYEGDTIALKADHPTLGLKAGVSGVVWALYALEAPAYEVTFRGRDGEAFDITMEEDALLPAALGVSGKPQVNALP